MGTRGGLGTAEERYREALKDARGYPSSRRPVAVLDNLAGATSTWLDATSTRDDELGPILGTTKQSDRQNISFGAAPTAAELEAAEAAEERYREALRDAKGYVSEAVTPQKQRPIAQPLLGTSSKDEDGEYNEDSNDGDEFVKDNYALLTAEAEAKVALLQPLHLFCRVYNRTPLSLQARADAKQAQLAAEEKMRGEQTSPPPKLAATAETEGQANLEDQFEAEVACWQERQEREARETEEEVTEKVRLAPSGLRKTERRNARLDMASELIASMPSSEHVSPACPATACCRPVAAVPLAGSAEVCHSGPQHSELVPKTTCVATARCST